MEERPYRLLAFVGFFTICVIAWLTGRCHRVTVKTIAGSLLLGWLIGGLTFWLPWSKWVLGRGKDVLVATLNGCIDYLTAQRQT